MLSNWITRREMHIGHVKLRTVTSADLIFFFVVFWSQKPKTTTTHKSHLTNGF